MSRPLCARGGRHHADNYAEDHAASRAAIHPLRPPLSRPNREDSPC